MVTLIAIFLIGLVPVKGKASLAAIAVILNAIITSIPALQAITGTAINLSVFSGNLLGNVQVTIDGLSAWFILIINFTSITGAIYGNGYLKEYQNSHQKLSLHWILFVIFHLSMVWVCLLHNGFAFLIAWEIMSISSMMLVIFDGNKPKTLKAGINYLVQMHISVVFLTIGFIWVYMETGSFSFEAFSAFFGVNSNIWLFLIFFVGFGIKAGFIPLHSWLPHAHPAAPSHVSGVMSGVIVKLGIYGILRVVCFLKTDFLLLGEIVLSVAILTGIYGILNAAVHRDFKRMLAYCTIENIGIIGIGIGLGLIGLGNGSPVLYYLGFGGALLHVLNHSLFKSLLFFSAGSVYQQTHTRNMEKLGGLIKQMPKTAILFLTGTVAIAGIPPFNGFVSEFIIYSGLLEGLKTGGLDQICLIILSFAGLSIIGGISLLAFTKSFGTIFLGSPRKTLNHQPHEVSSLMLYPQYLIVVAMMCIAFFPQPFLKAIEQVLGSMNNLLLLKESINFEEYSGTIAPINLYFLILIGIIGLIWGIRHLTIKGKSQKEEATWGCAYIAPNTRMQYTGKSFSKPLGKVFNFILIEEKKFKEIKPGEIFPKNRKYVSHYQDFFENRIFNFFTQRLVFGANYFKFIQNGRVQWYVLYGIAFVLLILILTALNVLK
ncbi:MAG TPA: proton-conducting transporter membrane subunit [Prolixibacteraceae bacterium]|nr:proton-conducting transporter membrane subunit [Prolixibacteraceae bacterium]HPS12351.1 proton-conducting transporter membrane subunit [Prolixibacteraceae bacterium]